MQKITPFLWFDSNAEEAAHYYTSIFKNSKILNVARYGDAGPGPKGSVMMVTFELEGQPFMALNGGRRFEYTHAISFKIDCADQAEVDRLWDGLSADGGSVERCGWLKDRYGVSWQIVPIALVQYLGGSDPAGAKRAIQAMMQMVKLDIAALKEAYEGKSAA